MSLFFQEFYHQEHTLFDFDLDDLCRSKTPSDSLINHTGLSPGPLTTSPPVSRNTSQPPEPSQDELPDHISWEIASPSSSPTSVRTPDDDSFDIELDCEFPDDFVGQPSTLMTSHAPQTPVSALDSSFLYNPPVFLSSAVIDEAYNATIASERQYSHLHHGFEAQPGSSMLAPQLQIDTSSQQPLPQHSLGSWTSFQVGVSPQEPQSGNISTGAYFQNSPLPEFVDGRNAWVPTTTYPDFATSQQEQLLRSPECVFDFSPQQAHLPSHTILRRDVPQSDLLENSYVHPAHHEYFQTQLNSTNLSPSFSGTWFNDTNFQSVSPATSSLDFPAAASVSISSPGSSNDLDFHQPLHEEASTDVLSRPHRRSSKKKKSPSRSGDEPTFVLLSESRSSRSRDRRFVGGRKSGTHLKPNTALAAHKMRRLVACWHCVLQRDGCSEGDICERCYKRSQRPNADCGLGCSRIKLVDLGEYLLPGLVTQMHEDAHLMQFVSQYISQWGNTEFTVHMTCGQRGMPRISVKVYEFLPKGNELLVQYQYVTDPKTNQRVALKKRSPALGMVHINKNEDKIYDNYVNQIVDSYLDEFGELCWMEDDNDFQQKLFRLMIRVRPQGGEETKLLREVYRLVVVTFIMSHTLTIAEENKLDTLSRMQSYGGPQAYVDKFTSPRMTNRQLKYFFSRLQRDIQKTLLNALQQSFKSSKGCDKWLTTFLVVVGMCMALEDQQKTIHLVMTTRVATEGLDARDAQSQADAACREIDTRMHFIQQIFRWKYNRKHNPLLNSEHDWEKEVGFGDESNVSFVRQVAQLVKDNTDYLQQRSRVSIANENQTKYSSRLVGQFLLSFWLPNA